MFCLCLRSPAEWISLESLRFFSTVLSLTESHSLSVFFFLFCSNPAWNQHLLET